MESDAVPEMPSHKSNEKKSNHSTGSTFTESSKSSNNINMTQHVHGNVFTFNDSEKIHIGSVINFMVPKKSKKSKTETSKKQKKQPTPQFITDVITVNDIKSIEHYINSSCYDLAKNIRTHIEHLKELDKLPHTQAIHLTLCSWIEEHDESALVAILIHNLWNMREFQAATKLAQIHPF